MTKHYKHTEFYYYPGKVWIPEPIGKIALEKFVDVHKNPKESILDTFAKIRKASVEGNRTEKDFLKQNRLYYFNPCIKTDGRGRGYKNITGFTGLAVLDFDKISNAKEFKYWLFEKLDCVICAYLSPSGFGVKFIIRIPICSTVDEFKSYIYGLGYYLEDYKGWDGSVQNCSLPLFISMDRDILYRDDAKIWNIKGMKIDSFTDAPEIDTDNINPTESDREFVKNIIKKRINDIVDEGHKTVLNTSLVAGGYCASGYIDFDQAEDLLVELIENNDYLSKNTKGYIRTAKEFLKKGMTKPLELDKD